MLVLVLVSSSGGVATTKKKGREEESPTPLLQEGKPCQPTQHPMIAVKGAATKIWAPFQAHNIATR